MTNTQTALGKQLVDSDEHTAKRVEKALVRTAREAMRDAVRAEQRCEELTTDLRTALEWRDEMVAIENATMRTLQSIGITCGELAEERAQYVDLLTKDRAEQHSGGV